jgi:uncharacterized membrane protein YoaK (UPF0700 family)
MNEHIKGITGTTTTIGGAIVAWLPVVNTGVQIIAGIAAIVAGIFTARYYCKKTNQLK